MKEVKIRWNTQCTDNHTFWRVIIDEEEFLCSNVIIDTPTWTTQDVVWDSIRKGEVLKHHITCKPNEIIRKGDVMILK